MPEQDELDESMLTEQTIAEMACGRAAIAKYAKRHEAALARRAAENGGVVAPDEAAQAAAGAQRLDRNAAPAPSSTVFPLAPEPYTPGKAVSGKK